MFTNDQKFRKAFKNAFEGTGVQVMNFHDRLYIATPEWAIEVDRANIPNKMLAAIIEMCGEIPPCGFAYTAIKGECNQETIVYSVWTPMEKYNELRARKVDKTPLRYKLNGCREWRVLQICDTRECILVDSELLNMLDEKAIDEEKEHYPKYPELCGGYLIWQNCMGALAIKASVPHTDTIEDNVLINLARVNMSSEQWSRVTKYYEGEHYAGEDEPVQDADSED